MFVFTRGEHIRAEPIFSPEVIVRRAYLCGPRSVERFVNAVASVHILIVLR